MKKTYKILLIAFSFLFIGPLFSKDQVTKIEGSKLVFVSATPKVLEVFFKKHGNQEGLGEAGADIDAYNLSAKDFAKAKGIESVDSNSEMIHFVKRNKSIFKLKNKVKGQGVDAYMFDGVQDPKKVNEIVLFSDGKEFSSYFHIKR